MLVLPALLPATALGPGVVESRDDHPERLGEHHRRLDGNTGALRRLRAGSMNAPTVSEKFVRVSVQPRKLLPVSSVPVKSESVRSRSKKFASWAVQRRKGVFRRLRWTCGRTRSQWAGGLWLPVVKRRRSARSDSLKRNGSGQPFASQTAR